MRFGRVLFVLALTALPAAGAGSGKIIHEPIVCVPAEGNGRLEASLAQGITASSVRVYYRAEGARDEYYAEMRRNQPGRYWAILPVVAPGQPTLVYRIVARETEGEFARTENFRVPVVAGCPANLSDEERRSARNIVLGLTSAEQGDSMTGFGCKGIVARISPAGDLKMVFSCVDGQAVGAAPGMPGSTIASASSSGTPSLVGVGSGTTASPSRPTSGNAGGLVIGGTQGTSAGVYGQPISSARPPK
jgi:hypothetical protein